MQIEEAKKLVPSKFRIACEEYTVVIDEKGEDYGSFCDSTNEIRLSLNIYEGDNKWTEVSKTKFMSTWYHELGHCFNYYWNTETDEGFAQAFSAFMMEFNETKQDEQSI